MDDDTISANVASGRNGKEDAMHALLTAIAVWLSASFDLPQTAIMPEVEFVPAAEMTTLRARALLGSRPKNATPAAIQMHPGQQQVLATYDDATRTIYLLEGWSDQSPADLSILVHEMVHHLQNVGGQRFDCVYAREKTALEAQNRWLKERGGSLERNFEIDPFTQLAMGLCIY
jgi:hypothetical protein